MGNLTSVLTKLEIFLSNFSLKTPIFRYKIIPFLGRIFTHGSGDRETQVSALVTLSVAGGELGNTKYPVTERQEATN